MIRSLYSKVGNKVIFGSIRIWTMVNGVNRGVLSICRQFCKINGVCHSMIVNSRLWPLEKENLINLGALDDKPLYEANTYKYLQVGTIINRQLKDTNYIMTHLSEILKKIKSYVRYRLSHHLNIKWITSVNTLLEKVVLPACCLLVLSASMKPRLQGTNFWSCHIHV